MILCNRGVADFDVIANMRYSEKTDYYGRPAGGIFRLPHTRQAEAFYADLLEVMGGVRLGSSDAPRLLERSSGEDRIEIYYGVSECEETKQILDDTELNEYGYCVKGKKIFIYGHIMQHLSWAGDRFFRDLRKGVVVHEDFVRSYSIGDDAEKRLSAEPLAIMEIPKPRFGGKLLTCDDGIYEDARMYVVSECALEDYNAYIGELENDGFALYDSNDMRGNLSATYTKGDITVDAWYTKDGYVRITACRGFALSPKEKRPYEKVTTPSMHLIGHCAPGQGDGGQMLYYFQLSDGRFVIIDAGSHRGLIDVLMSELRSKALDPENIVVACWLFTHTHGDHTQALGGLSDNFHKYKDILTVESFMYNFPGNEQAIVPWQGVYGGDWVSGIINSRFPNATKYKVHPGNKAWFADMHIEVISTHESFVYMEYPNNTNACNTFFKLTIAGQVIMIPGDTSDFDQGKLVELYGDYLKCDILQAPHHGGHGSGTVEVSKLYAPQFVVFSHTRNTYMGDASYFFNQEYNQWLINSEKNPNFKEFVLIDHDIFDLPLPYTHGCVTKK